MKLSSEFSRNFYQLEYSCCDIKLSSVWSMKRLPSSGCSWDVWPPNIFPDVYSPFPFSYLYNLVSDPWMIHNTPEHYWWLWILYLKVYSDLDGPDRLLQRVEELEAEAVLLRGPLNELAGVEQHRSNPLAVFVGFIDEQHAWFQHTPQLGPALQSATNLNHIQINVRYSKASTHPSDL